MPSPFPGMDPYLENPGFWPDVHATLIAETRNILNVRLRPSYMARIEERVYISDEHDPGRKVIVPDVRILEREPGSGTTASTGGAAVLECVAQPIEATTMLDEHIHESRIAIVDLEDRMVVAVLEILSPTNKLPGSAGEANYLEKRREVLRTRTHLVEIDLLRGPRPFSVGQQLPPHDYLVHVSRAGNRPRGTLWPIRLKQRLPVIPIPLKAGDPDAKLDLQEVLNTAYDRAGYDLAVDYRREPVPPLEGELAAWGRQIADKAAVAPK